MLREATGERRGPGTLARRAGVLLLGAPLLSLGCSGVMAKGDGRALGDDLGRFAIDATLESSTCGPNALAAPSDFRLDVFLSEDPPTLYWNSGADAVEGQLERDRMHFTFASQTVVNVLGAESAAATCTIVRDDSAAGALDAATAARNLSGSLDYRFSAEGQSDCTAAMAQEGLSTLPCRMSYRMAGTWISAR